MEERSDRAGIQIRPQNFGQGQRQQGQKGDASGQGLGHSGKKSELLGSCQGEQSHPILLIDPRLKIGKKVGGILDLIEDGSVRTRVVWPDGRGPVTARTGYSRACGLDTGSMRRGIFMRRTLSFLANCQINCQSVKCRESPLLSASMETRTDRRFQPKTPILEIPSFGEPRPGDSSFPVSADVPGREDRLVQSFQD